MMTLKPHWHAIEIPPPLGKNKVHIWKVGLKGNSAKQHEFFNMLSADEKKRANRFKFSIHRERFIVSQGMLRKILSYYLNIDPAHISFNYGAHGKPYVENKYIFFNLSNSEDIAIYGFALDNEIGVDVEYHRSQVDYHELVKRFFSEQENHYFLTLPKEEQKEAFFKLWTAKEAFIKALGEGLSFPLKQFTVNVETTHEGFKEIKGDTLLAKTWYLQIFIPAPNFTAALAYPQKLDEFLFLQPKS